MSDDTRPVRATGSCLCGAVRYEIRGPLRAVTTCHCTQCRKQTGHFMAATAAQKADFKLTEQVGLKWYQSSTEARRAFCSTCGSTLFWEGKGKDYFAIAAGTLDGATGLSTVKHIFVANKGDYYEIDDDAPQLAAW